MQQSIYHCGLDVGSTTAKICIVDDKESIIFSSYERHNTRINETVAELFRQALKSLGNLQIEIAVTGSAGIGISEKLHIPFLQEVISATEVIKRKYPEVKTLIDIGGEDSKMIFFDEHKPPDIRMNGNCAGGTGAFIDQMSVLFGVSIEEFDILARQYTRIHPIASRCGVFAKTDVQTLLSSKIPKADIAASIYHAVALQLLNTLSRGFDIKPKVMFVGGPFSFLLGLKDIFIKDLKIDLSDVVSGENPALFPAYGAAIYPGLKSYVISLSDLIDKLEEPVQQININHRLNPLFDSTEHFEKWTKERFSTVIKKIPLKEYQGKRCFIGIDSGSTTTKIAVIGENKELLFHFYANNQGNPIETVKTGMMAFVTELRKNSGNIRIERTGVTGYGEDLIKAALGIDAGIVETIAHYLAAHFLNPDVSFIMDIGGQDMKAVFIDKGIVNRIELNESCSSGCGTFIETFGNGLGHSIVDFSQSACAARTPCDLGTRCTVFMNSKVKQSLRENATTGDIAAGLAVSVIKNALFKVLKLKDYKELGDNIVVQGGTFKNPAVHRAMEVLTGKKVLCSDIPEQMGALGAALMAVEVYNQEPEKHTSFIGIEQLDKLDSYNTQLLRCKGCENNCSISKFSFKNGNFFYSGNQCEKIYTNKGSQFEKGFDMFEYKYNLIFKQPAKPSSKPLMRIGIPRVLNVYENFPFWNTLLTECNIELILSTHSSTLIYEKGSGSIMSDSICFPAKLVHGHIFDLVDKKVDRIFYPMVFFEEKELKAADNSYNCPIVSSYADVIRSSINTELKYNIPFDSPVINFSDISLLKEACYTYLRTLGVSKSIFNEAFTKSLEMREKIRQNIKSKAKEIISMAHTENRLVILLAGRPYHFDPLINHKSPQILSEMGVDVLTEDCLPFTEEDKNEKIQTISQWTYPNRIYKAAQWIAKQPNNFQFVQLNSFGCGPDVIVTDESSEILKTKGKNHTLIRIDEITSTGSIRLRLRSMIESLRLRDKNYTGLKKIRITTAPFQEKDKQRIILAPMFAEMYSHYLPSLFKLAGYTLINLPKPDKESVEYGLKYTNNEICYPATIVVGDVIKALLSGQYDLSAVAIGITQSGGQCRASSYLALIKKAMVNAGFSDVPVISVNSGNTENDQPGFRIEWDKMLNTVFVNVIYADSLAKLYYSTVVREKNKGDAQKLYNQFAELSYNCILTKDATGFFNLIEKAVEEFNKIPVYDKKYPQIGIVGEIYVKYNAFGHQNIVEWLIEQGIEVVVPPILDFFIQGFVNYDVNKKNFLMKVSFKSNIFLYFLEKKSNYYIRKANKILSKYKYYSPLSNIREIAHGASEILSLTNQFGEGWLIPAEISEFAKMGINNVVSVQPFGCIANQVISKGVEKRIKDLYPQMSLLYLDFDDGVSPVNIINRLHFMVKNVKD